MSRSVRTLWKSTARGPQRVSVDAMAPMGYARTLGLRTVYHGPFMTRHGTVSRLAKRSRRNRPKKSSAAPRRRGGERAGAASSVSSLRVRKVVGQDAWELVHPRCARDRALDLEEVRKMLDAGEVDVAIDECRWLL